MSMYRHAPKIERMSKASTANKRAPRKAAPNKKQAPNKRRAPVSQPSTFPWRKIGRTTLTVVCGGALLAAAGFAIFTVISSPRLAVRTVEIVGHQRADRDTLLAYGGLRIGQSIFEMSLDEAARNLRRHPWVADATVTRAFPDRVVVRVEEQEPAALVSLGGLYLANGSGELFKRWVSSDPRDLPLITGLRREDVGVDDGVVTARIVEGIEIARDLGEWQDSIGSVEELHFDAALGWSAVVRRTEGHTTRITLGPVPHDRIPLAAQTLSELGRRELLATVVRVDGRKRPGRVHVSLKQSPNLQMEEASE